MVKSVSLLNWTQQLLWRSLGRRSKSLAIVLYLLTIAAHSPCLAERQSPIDKLDPWFRHLSNQAEYSELPSQQFETDSDNLNSIQTENSSPISADLKLLVMENRVRVQIETGPAGDDVKELTDQCLLQSPSIRWEGFAGNFAQATVAVSELIDLAAVEEISAIVTPPVCLPQTRSAGVDEIGAAAYIQEGTCGDGIRIGILDVSFTGAADLIGDELPADTEIRSFWHTGSGEVDITGGEERGHGTACAEIISDIAPCAELFLCNARTLVEMETAIRWLREEGVHVINHSVGWFWGPGDGTGTIVDIVKQATDAGIIWVNAAGNYGQQYWEGSWHDDDGDGYHEFDSMNDQSITYDNPAPGTEMRWYLLWDRWPYTAGLSYELELYEDSQLVASSENMSASARAYRELSFISSPSSKPLRLQIRKTMGEAEAKLRIFQIHPGSMPEHGRASGSLVIPADAPSVLSVGAYRRDGNTPVLEEFSSRGPTQSGLAKPEICGLDRVDTSLWANFTGTSAAAPHVAGAAALLLDAAPAGGFFDYIWSRAELYSLLERYAVSTDLGDINSTLWGLLHLPSLTETGKQIAGPRLTIDSPTRAPLQARLHDVGKGYFTFRVVSPEGRVLYKRRFEDAESEGPLRIEWDGRDSNGQSAASGHYWITAQGDEWISTRSMVLVR